MGSMITEFREVSTEHPTREMWKYLRRFVDGAYVEELICKQHGISDQSRNIKKQARQLAYCIRQAEEYFEAAEHVGLPTKPNLLYYGAASLSSALILLKQTGDYSFDRRRQDKGNSHAHHGLDLNRGKLAPLKNLDPVAILTALESNCYLHRATAQPWGNFILFYRSVEPPGFMPRQSPRPFPCAPKRPEAELLRDKFVTLDLLKTLPDLFYDLSHLAVEPKLCAGLIDLGTYVHIPDGRRESRRLVIRLDNISSAYREQFLRWYQSRNPTEATKDMARHPSYVFIEIERDRQVSDPQEQWVLPYVTDALPGHTFFVMEPDSYLLEPVTFLIVLFNLGMLARYYPDIWMKAIDENARTAHLLGSVLNVAWRKFPNLILDQLTSVKHHFHSQSNFWALKG